jgi:hypothetical protein
VAAGDSGREAYTAIAWGVGLSHERLDIAGAESFYSLEGNMCGTATRGADALPGSKATSRAKGSHRKLGGLASGRQELRERDGPHREGEEPKPMMHGHEKSDSAIVAVKPANKAVHPAAEQSAAEPIAAEPAEPRAETKGNAHQQSTCRTQSRISVSQALDACGKQLPFGPEVGAVCGKAARTDLRGGRSVMSVPTASCASRKLVRSSR